MRVRKRVRAVVRVFVRGCVCVHVSGCSLARIPAPKGHLPSGYTLSPPDNRLGTPVFAEYGLTSPSLPTDRSGRYSEWGRTFVCAGCVHPPWLSVVPRGESVFLPPLPAPFELQCAGMLMRTLTKRTLSYVLC